MSTTQQSLIEKLGQRDPDAWDRLKATYTGLVRSYLRKHAMAHGHHHFDNYVDDVVQEVWVRLICSTNGHPYDRSRGRFRTFLYTVSVNALNDFFRRERRHVKGRREMPDTDGMTTAESDKDKAEWDADYKQVVLNAVLEEIRRELLSSNPVRWNSFEKYTLLRQPAAEVAPELGISVASVYQNTSRVLTELRERAQAQYEEDPTR
jgi:RNA polymerase sigma factor (sigma-70 family)